MSTRFFSLLTPKDPQRADKVLSALFDDMSRSWIQKLFSEEKIKINGKTCSKKELIQKKDELTIYLNTKSLELKPENLELEIIYQDDDMVVVNKDPFINVHPVPGEGGNSGTLVNALLHHVKDLGTINGVERPGIIHRLDKETSGLLIVAKNDTSMGELSEIIAQRKIKKTYITLVVGIPNEPEGTILSEIGRDRYHRKRMTTKNPINPKEAETGYKVVESGSVRIGKNDIAWSLIEVDLRTGRTHQIRVHMASIGHPIIGDNVYGNTAINSSFRGYTELKRQFLHASRLELEFNGENHVFEAPLKPDLQRTLKKMRE